MVGQASRRANSGTALRSANKTGIFAGIDSWDRPSQALLDKATKVIGQQPKFWGRYFKRAETIDPPHYNHQLESNFLRANNIRVLPLARQTNRVAGSAADGRKDGTDNAVAVISAFGRGYLSS